MQPTKVQGQTAEQLIREMQDLKNRQQKPSGVDWAAENANDRATARAAADARAAWEDYANAYNQGNAAWQQGDLAAAEQHYRDAAKLCPKNDENSWGNICILLITQGKDSEVAEAKARALKYGYKRKKLDQRAADALTNRGYDLGQSNDDMGAEAKYREAIQYNPECARAWNNLGAMLQKQGKLKEAEQHYQKAAKLDSKKPLYKENVEGIRTAIAEQAAREAEARREAQARLEREAAELKVAVEIRQKISDLAASLDTGAPRDGGIVTQRGVDKDGRAPLSFGNPEAPENLAEQGRQGFDKDGHIKATATPAAATVPTTTAYEVLPVSIPKEHENDPQVVSLKREWEAARAEQVAAERELERIKELRKVPGADLGELSLQEVNGRFQQGKAKSKKYTAEVGLGDVLRTFAEQKL